MESKKLSPEQEAKLAELRKRKQKERQEVEKAELIQSITALYIPFSLFISCVVFAAGCFLVYHGEPIGWAFIAATIAIALSAFFALIKFQNKFRAKGIVANKEDTEMVKGLKQEAGTSILD